MRIILSKEQIRRYSQIYDYDGEDTVATTLDEAIRRGSMTRDELAVVAKWKWRGGRTKQLVLQNSEDDVQEITRVSFAATSERLRIGALLALRGVSWPMASVILHFAFPGRYPILDERAMRTVDGSTLYTFEIWQSYTELCRKTAQDMDLSMRVLDRALWAFDKAESAHAPAKKNELLRLAVANKLEELLMHDEAGWLQAAEWIHGRALEDGFDIAADFKSAKAFAHSFLEGMRIHVELGQRFPRGTRDLERFEVAEELFWHIMPQVREL